MRFKRSHRIQELIYEGISKIVQRGLNDPRIGFATITKVELSDNLKHAKIFVSVMGSEQEKADTLAKQIYFVVQLIYMDGGIDNSRQNHKIFFKLIREFIDLYPGSIGLEIIGEIGQLILDGADYQALAQSRKLIEYEKTLFNRRLDTDVPADVRPQAEKALPADVANQLETRS